MPFINTIQASGLDRNTKTALIREFQALRDELDDIRSKFAAIQTALNAGTAVGAAGYPNATTALGSKKATAT